MARALEGSVIDADTGAPITGAIVVAGNESRITDDRGFFDFGSGNRAAGVAARAIGYGRVSEPVRGQIPSLLRLSAIRPRAVYLSVYGIGNESLREGALKLVGQTELNALVIDVKGDRGLVPFRSRTLAMEGLAQSFVSVADMPALIDRLHRQGLYLIARIVVFKDQPLAERHPEWAVRTAAGLLWHDRENLPWIDPFQQEAWAHSLSIAEEAAQQGFDEIQFDYVRFPDARDANFSEVDTADRRVATIGAYFDAARQRLARYNVFVSADIFGYVAWNSNDTGIGQQLESIIGHVDYLSPMLYPSGFTFGIPGYRNPVANPFEIVQLSLRRAQQRTGQPGVRLRPWLQAFRDYGFDHRNFCGREIRLQIDAAESTHSDGWMLWNPGNHYGPDGLAGPHRESAAAITPASDCSSGAPPAP